MINGDKYRVHELLKYEYSDIGEYVDENHTDRPLRNDEVVNLLNKQENKLKRISREVDCNIYRDDLKDIIFEIRCILNGDIE